jgi:hypothetical protein
VPGGFVSIAEGGKLYDMGPDGMTGAADALPCASGGPGAAGCTTAGAGADAGGGPGSAQAAARTPTATMHGQLRVICLLPTVRGAIP